MLFVSCFSTDKHRMQKRPRWYRYAFFAIYSLSQNSNMWNFLFKALWRGYRSRKKIHSFYDRKKFLQEVQEKNEQTLKSMNTFRASEELRLTEEQHRRQKQAYERRLSREHHLLSTTAMKGVYARPLAPVLEDDLRKTSKLQQTLLLSHLSIGTSKV